MISINLQAVMPSLLDFFLIIEVKIQRIVSRIFNLATLHNFFPCTLRYTVAYYYNIKVITQS